MKQVTVDAQCMLLDDEDWPLLEGKLLHTHATRKTIYVYYMDYKTNVYVHRLLLSASEGQVVDHIDGNGLNNQRSNLRLVTHGQNRQRSTTVNNNSGFKGVSLHARTGKFQAKLWSQNKTHHLGSYETAEEAARAYDKKAKELFGEHCFVNFPDAE